MVKTEMGVLPKVDPEAKRAAESTIEQITAAEYGVGSEPDDAVKGEVVSLPSKRKAAGGS